MSSITRARDLHFKIFLILLFSLIWFDGILFWPKVRLLFSIDEGLNDYKNLYVLLPSFALPFLLNLWVLKGSLILAFIASFFLFFTKTRTLGVVLILISSIYFRSLNRQIGSPDVGFITWILCMFILAPSDFSFLKKNKEEEFWIPTAVLWATRIMAGFNYSLSGFFKVTTPRWQNGTMLNYLLSDDSHLVLPWITPLGGFTFLDPFFKVATWFVMLLELTAIFTYLGPAWLFQWCNLVFLLLHFSLLVSFDIGHISFAMVVFHFYLINPDYWMRFIVRRKCHN